MPRKRMILEEVPEVNQLVLPGDPDNPIKVGEKAKIILTRLKLSEDIGKPGEIGRVIYDEIERNNAIDRLLFLKLIERREIPPTQEKLVELHNLKLQVMKLLESGAGASAVSTAASTWQSADYYAKPVVNLHLTDAGRSLLLSGTVTITL